MLYATIKDNAIVNTYNSIPQSWGNEVSGFDKLTDSEREAFGFFRVLTPDLSQYDPQIHRITRDEIIVADGRPVFAFEYINIYSEEELKARAKEAFYKNVRDHRNFLLSKCDWTMSYDVIKLRGEEWTNSWIKYREELRNITEVKEFDIELYEKFNGIFSVDMFPQEPNLC